MRRSKAWSLLPVLGLLGGCAPVVAKPSGAPTAAPAPAPSPAAIVPAPAQRATVLDRTRCNAVHRSSEPDLVTLDPSSRANVARLRTFGAMVVRYEGEGCDAELRVLPSCVGAAQKYTFSPYAASTRKLARDPSELLSTMPLGASGLVGWLSEDRALRADVMLSGQWALAPDAIPRPQDLLGADCARATHVVAAVYVGAFAMVAGDTSLLERRATVLDLGPTSPEIQTLATEGSVEACRAAVAEGRPNDRCAVPVRVALVPLDNAAPTIAAAPAVCPPGSVRRGERCVMHEIVTEVDCPAGTKWSGERCTPNVATKTTKAAAAPPPAVPVAALPPEPGHLSLDTYPFTNVWIDERLVGVTPLVNVELAPGTHTIRMENPPEALSRSVVITVKPGESVSRRLAF